MKIGRRGLGDGMNLGAYVARTSCAAMDCRALLGQLFDVPLLAMWGAQEQIEWPRFVDCHGLQVP